MKELYKLVNAELDTCGFTCKITNNPPLEITEFPIVIFKVNNRMDYSLINQKANITIDVFTKEEGIETVENMVDIIDRKFNRQNYNMDYISCITYRQTIWNLNLDEGENNVKHRQLKYYADLY